MTEPEQITEAEQLAVPVWMHRLASKIVLGNHGVGNAGVLIQRAFEERERELRGKLSRYERGAGPDDWRDCPGQCGESCCGYHDACRRALKETPDAG